jgi:transposase InsO family protein
LTFFAVVVRVRRSGGGLFVLVELGLVEQRYAAVREVLEGASVVDVARRNGVARQTVHDWLRKYAAGGMAALVDRSSKPQSCAHQIPAAVEARIVELRRAHPGWGPRTILDRLAREGVEPLPGRSSVHRALLRHGLIEPGKRRRRREDYKRWERGRAMELWQMDVVGRIFLADGTELYAITGVDDHSRFCVCARLVARATARPVCDALAWAMRTHGVPDQILTDNGKVFTARFGTGPGPVLFDRICADNGIRHLLTAPYSPTTTGKVERFHRTLRAEWARPNERRFATIVEAQASLDAWVEHYNTERPHQSLGMASPVERFRLAQRRGEVVEAVEPPVVAAPTVRPAGVTRWVDQRGSVSLAGFRYRVGIVFAGECVEVVCHGGLVEIFHAGVLVATHVQRRPADQVRKQPPAVARLREATVGVTVTRIADANGSVSFAGTSYRAGRAWARVSIEVAIVGGSVQLSKDGKVIRVHPIRHDRSRELGAFANPKGRPRSTAQG